MKLNTTRSWIAAGRKKTLVWLLTQPEHPDILFMNGESA